MHIELAACCFGQNMKTKEGGDERAARLQQRTQSNIDARALRQRRMRIAKGKEANPLAAASLTLGAGL